MNDIEQQIVDVCKSMSLTELIDFQYSLAERDDPNWKHIERCGEYRAAAELLADNGVYSKIPRVACYKRGGDDVCKPRETINIRKHNGSRFPVGKCAHGFGLRIDCSFCRDAAGVL